MENVLVSLTKYHGRRFLDGYQPPGLLLPGEVSQERRHKYWEGKWRRDGGNEEEGREG